MGDMGYSWATASERQDKPCVLRTAYRSTSGCGPLQDYQINLGFHFDDRTRVSVLLHGLSRQSLHNGLVIILIEYGGLGVGSILIVGKSFG